MRPAVLKKTHCNSAGDGQKRCITEYEKPWQISQFWLFNAATCQIFTLARFVQSDLCRHASMRLSLPESRRLRGRHTAGALCQDARISIPSKRVGATRSEMGPRPHDSVHAEVNRKWQ